MAAKTKYGELEKYLGRMQAKRVSEAGTIGGSFYPEEDIVNAMSALAQYNKFNLQIKGSRLAGAGLS